MFADRSDAGRRLGERLSALGLERALALGIPRGGVVVAAEAARAMGAELDVALARKIGAPRQPELAIGAVDEDGGVWLDEDACRGVGADEEYLRRAVEEQLEEIGRRAAMFRRVRPRADVRGRDVVVIDDGLATGATMAAALRATRARGARRLIAAVPVGAGESVDLVRPLCDGVVCLETPAFFRAVGEHYRRFGQVSDAEALAVLQGAG